MQNAVSALKILVIYSRNSPLWGIMYIATTSDLKVNRGHVLALGKIPSKFYKPSHILFKAIDQTRLTGSLYGQANIRTDHHITGWSPLFLSWGMKKEFI